MLVPKGNDAPGITVMAPGGIDQAGLSILASRWAEALKVNGCSCELILGKAKRHPDEGPAAEIDDMPRAIDSWCDRASDMDRLLVVGLPSELGEARSTIAALSGAGSRATVLWERPHTPILGLAELLCVAPPADIRIATLNPKFVSALKTQFEGNAVAALPLSLPPVVFEVGAQRRGQDPFAIAIGRFTTRKGAARLSQKWAKDVGPRLRLKLLMLGAGYGGADSEEEAVLEVARSSPWVECEQIGPLRDRLDCIRAASCAVFAAIDDHLPQALVEALAVEVPVIVTPIAGHLEVVDDEVTGFVLRGTGLDDLGEVVEKRVLGDPAGSLRVSRSGSERVRRLCEPSTAGRAILAYLL